MPRHRSLRHIVAAFLTAVGLAGGALVNGPATADLLDPDPRLNVIIQLWDGADSSARLAVMTLGGEVTAELPVVNGFAATVPASAIEALASLTSIRFVSPDTPVHFQEAMPDGGPASVHKEVLAVADAHAAGQRGAGSNVALIDTGVAAVEPVASRLVQIDGKACKNFSNESGCNDSLGHGTFIAGLVNDVAPDAGIVSVKLAGRDGQARLSALLEALGWTIANRESLGIKVVNLSLKTFSPLSYRIDPINLAVDRAWAAGLTVVVSAGNDGPVEGTIAKPGDTPSAITVGSTDDRGTASLDDDVVAQFSGRGVTVPDGVAKPDLVVPGKSLVSLRSPGSEADLNAPNFVSATKRRGSGTSFSAPLVAGAAAVLHAADPEATNDRVKFALTSAGRPIAGASPTAAGAGTISMAGALSAPAGLANQTYFHPLFWPERPASLEDVVGSAFEDDWLAAAAEGWNWQGWNWQGWNWQGWNWQGWNWQDSNWQDSNWQGWNWQGWNWQGWNWQGWNWQGWNWQGWNWQGWNWQNDYWI